MSGRRSLRCCAVVVSAVFGVFPVAFSRADSGDPNVHQGRRARPIELGVSGINREDYCFVRGGNFVVCGTGTLGSLVEDGGGTNYILSNNHVLAILNDGIAGQSVIQPGYLDDCFNSNPTANEVADLSEFVALDFSGADNLVDSAIAEVRLSPACTNSSGSPVDCVRGDGFILDIGTVNTTTLEATPSLAVKKSGRTTGFTTGSVNAVNVTVNVGYAECGSSSPNPSFVGHFVDQMEITPGGFSAGGDSGSLIVENVASNPRAVGLLFAGSSASTIANRIQNVLCAFSVPLAMTGGMPACAGGCTSNADCTGGQICCNQACVSAVCSSNAECDDSDACTTDTCNNAGTCSASCSNTGPACGPSDGCCPAGCSSSQDPDCPSGPVCGNDVCEVGGGEDCLNCPADCNGQTSGRPANRYCCGDTVDCSDPRCTGNGNTCQQGASAIQPLPRRVTVTLPQVGDIQARHSNALLAIPDVVGHGITHDADGSPVILVYLAQDNPASRAQIPATIEGVRTAVKVSGPFMAYTCVPHETAETYRRQLAEQKRE